MNNEPVAWIIDANMTDCDDNFIWNTGGYPDWQVKDWIPLYTHPVDAVNISEQYVDKSENNRHDLGIAEAIGFDKGYAAAQSKTLTDEAIITVADPLDLWAVPKDKLIEFAKAILRKAQEK